MKLSSYLSYLVAAQSINAASIASSENALLALEDRRVVPAAEVVSPDHTLERRKGGGRGGGSSGGGGGRGGGSSTAGGSGRARTFNNGAVYAGGSPVPYAAGRRTPGGLVAGALILPLAMVAIMPGLWLYSTYPYYYNNPYRFYNESATNEDDDDDDDRRRSLWPRQSSGRNETLPVMCVCMENDGIENNLCSCEETDDQSHLDELVGNGSYAALNKTLVTVWDNNGTKTLVINGTLPPDTTAPGAANQLGGGRFAGYYALGVMVLAAIYSM
ncbi:hypothetical protein BDW02DRAFT_591447 [Decorospora gaudefroyi]|uniref:DUF7732 domain-containing protein n=1 Tax=Decorospora gaudefroyi TaxID=184978 RepID=A0A6A5K1Z7_9PLEO|nr:hypothetical protein BDW02DRAFT_591447 [Decorospora gaudefroyi]